MKNRFLKGMIIALILCLSVPFSRLGHALDPADYGLLAYGENIGWLFSDPNYPGYIWAENIGWINLSPIIFDGSGNLSGYGWSENAGWVSFSCENTNSCGTVNYGVSIDPNTGLLRGYAWAENIGWVNFNAFNTPQIETHDVRVGRGGGATRRHFWIGDWMYYFIDYNIIGGDPNAKYDVVGRAYSIYEYCSTKRARTARGVDDNVGPGLNTITFRKRVPDCVKPPDYVTARGEWPKVKWAVKLKTQDGNTLLDKDRLRTRHTHAVHWD
jgi:hypothetical protein